MGLVAGQCVILSYLEDRADEYSRLGPLELAVIPPYHGEEISDEIWTGIELNIRGKHKVCSGCSASNIPGYVDWIVQVQPLLKS